MQSSRLYQTLVSKNSSLYLPTNTCPHKNIFESQVDNHKLGGLICGVSFSNWSFIITT